MHYAYENENGTNNSIIGGKMLEMAHLRKCGAHITKLPTIHHNTIKMHVLVGGVCTERWSH